MQENRGNKNTRGPAKGARGKALASFVLLSMVIGANIGMYFFVLKGQDPRVWIKGSFPNPFIFNNGSAVSSVPEWNERRGEIKDILMDIEYGHLPGVPDALNVTLLENETRADNSTKVVVNITVVPSNSTPGQNFTFTTDIYVPEGSGPFPAIVKVSPDGTGTQEENNMTITGSGYIYACFHHVDLDPDQEGVVGPAQAAYPGHDWGSLMVWAWGAMRVADYLLGESWVNAPWFPGVRPDALIVAGHSRRGKTALLASAFDERFSMVDCNGGCAGGAASYLVLGVGAETLGDITSQDKYHYWFQEDFGQYAGRETELPFDQHFLRALVAPRVMLTTDGEDDLWANPIGVQAVYEAAQPFFDFLGVPGRNGIHFRAGGHGFKARDFEVLLNFAGTLLLNDTGIVDEFYDTPYDIDFPIYYQAP